jgi:hypothetical protein
MEPSTTRSIEFGGDATAPLDELAGFEWSDLFEAQESGRDPHELRRAFWRDYEVACRESEARTFAEAEAQGVPPCELMDKLVEAMADAGDRVPEEVKVSGIEPPPPHIRRAYERRREARASRPTCTRGQRRPTRAARQRTRTRTSASTRSSVVSRGSPDDDPHEPNDGLSGRAAELARELQAASDALIAAWRSERIARATPEQLSFEGPT